MTTSKLQLGTVSGLCQPLNRAWESTGRMLSVQTKTVPGSLSTINPYRQESSVQEKGLRNDFIYLDSCSSSLRGMHFLYLSLTLQLKSWNCGAIIIWCHGKIKPTESHDINWHHTTDGTYSAWPVQQQSQRIWSISLHSCPGWPSACLIRTQVTTGLTGNHISGLART